MRARRKADPEPVLAPASLPAAAPPRVVDGSDVPVDGESISYRLTVLLNRLVSVMNDASATDYRAQGLSIPAARAIIGLFEAGGRMTVGQLAATTSIDFSTMSHILRRLEAQALLTRERGQQDNRIVHAVLTAEGHVVAAKCREASLRHEEVLLGDMAEAEAHRLKEILVRVYANARRGFAM